MAINSISFLLFFIVVFFLYYFPLQEKTKAQNIVLLLISYIFYGIANWRMIPLLILVTGIFYWFGILIKKANETHSGKATLVTTLGVCLGIGILLYFKYFNFFIRSFSNLFSAIGLYTNWSTFNIIMPIGISFFTFKLISYVIEINRQHIEPAIDIITFAAYIAFFPTIMSGPIDRPNAFIPQLQLKRSFNYPLAVDGCRQILWGLFKKMVIADNIAVVVDLVWNNISETPGINLMIASFLYSIQMYADFSGYSNMAIGVGKILGFRITKNFNYPFFSRNIADFWSNWHISLTSWLTDYVFMPLNIKFRNMGKLGIILAIIINFVLIGAWHGANWTFVIFGLYHGLLYIPLILFNVFAKKRKLSTNQYDLPSLKTFIGIACTFVLVSFGNIIFRADNIEQAWKYIRQMVITPKSFYLAGMGFKSAFPAIVSAVAMFIFEWFDRNGSLSEWFSKRLNRVLRWTFYMFVIFLLLIFMKTQGTPFLYFQF
jgi:D-alanyl-lipoteichoic acid acyltransferase DltB (MBOAT superfamily)